MTRESHWIHMLRGGDRRAIGRAAEAVEMVLQEPGRLSELLAGLRSGDPVLAMRCADVAEKATRMHPEWLAAHQALLLGPLMAHPQQEVRWHLAPMLVRLPLSDKDARRVFDWLLVATQDRSRLVCTMAMQGLADLTVAHPGFAAEVRRHIEELTITGSPAMRARGRKLLARWPV